LRRIATNTLGAYGAEIKPPAYVEIPKQHVKVESKIEDRSAGKQTVVPAPPKMSDEAKSSRVRNVFNLPFIGGIAGGLLILGFLIWGASRLFRNMPAATVESTSTFQANATLASQPSTTISSQPSATIVFQPEPTNTLSPVETAISAVTPTLGMGSTMTGKDGMELLYVPAGEFTMGMAATDAIYECRYYDGPCPDSKEFKTEEPRHKSNIDAFWIDKTEVTNNMYAKCVHDGRCSPPQPPPADLSPVADYYGESEFDDYAVTYISWNQAYTYCSWAERRLPTEAEWEKAASWSDSSKEQYVYPWGNNFDGTTVNFCDENCAGPYPNRAYNDGYRYVSPVGNYPDGESFYGALDMAGNVWEWVDGWFDVYPDGDPSVFPANRENLRVLRGGAFYTRNVYVRSADRFDYDPNAPPQDSFGFRCAMDATP
jgi:formylglycine-generating enzyme required for sulfatase activity